MGDFPDSHVDHRDDCVPLLKGVWYPPAECWLVTDASCTCKLCCLHRVQFLHHRVLGPQLCVVLPSDWEVPSGHGLHQPSLASLGGGVLVLHDMIYIQTQVFKLLRYYSPSLQKYCLKRLGNSKHPTQHAIIIYIAQWASFPL